MALTRAVRRRRLTARAIIAGAIVVLALLAASLGLIVRRMHDRDIGGSVRSLESFDLLLAEHTSSVFNGVSVVVEQLAEDIEARHLTDQAALKAEYASEATFVSLRRHSLDLPQIDALSIVAADGTVVSLSRGFPVPQINLSDRTYFQRARDPASPVTFVTDPLLNRGDHKTWDIYFVRRLALPDGHLLGLVLGAVKLSYFEQLYQELGSLGPDAISLWRVDGVLLARYPPLSDALGAVNASKTGYFATMAHGETRSFIDIPGADDRHRVIASHRLRDQDLVVDVSQTMGNVLRDWRHDVAIVVGAGLLCAISGAVLIVLAIRQLHAYAALADAVAEREEAELARAAAEKRLEESEKLEAIGRLTAGIAHDFNNLLTTIIGNAELLRRQFPTPPTSRRVALIADATERGSAMIRQLLAFARRQELSPAAIDFNEVVTSTLALMKDNLPACIELRAECADGLWPGFADRLQIGNALLNLLVNAKDAMPSGGAITVSTRNVAPGEAPAQRGRLGDRFVCIAVRDTGHGMDRSVQARAFDPFFTTKSPGKGSGLGLSQVYGLATQSGGFVEIDSERGVGTVVTLFLPVATVLVAGSTLEVGEVS